MNKQEQVMTWIEEGKTFEEICETHISTPSYIRRCFTMAGASKEEKPADETQPAPESEAPVPAQDESVFDRQMEQMEEASKEKANEKASAMAEAFKMVMEDPQAFMLAMNTLAGKETKETKSSVRIKVSKCHRHPHIDVKPGENCEECIQISREDEARTITQTYVLPCPKCGDRKKQRHGGYIKKHLGKEGHYACGNCRISYNIAGECVPWGPKDQHFFDKAIKNGVY